MYSPVNMKLRIKVNYGLHIQLYVEVTNESS